VNSFVAAPNGELCFPRSRAGNRLLLTRSPAIARFLPGLAVMEEGEKQ